MPSRDHVFPSTLTIPTIPVQRIKCICSCFTFVFCHTLSALKNNKVFILKNISAWMDLMFDCINDVTSFIGVHRDRTKSESGYL